VNPIIIPPPAHPAPPLRTRAALRAARLVPACIRHGRPGALALRTAAALTLAEAAALSGAGPAPVIGTVAGIATWLAVTARSDLAPPPDGTP